MDYWGNIEKNKIFLLIFLILNFKDVIFIFIFGFFCIIVL